MSDAIEQVSTTTDLDRRMQENQGFAGEKI
jgi:hypothetical protein